MSAQTHYEAIRDLVAILLQDCEYCSDLGPEDLLQVRDLTELRMSLVRHALSLVCPDTAKRLMAEVYVEVKDESTRS